MKTYTVLVPPGDGSTGEVDPMDVRLIKEGISWPALFLPLLWLIFQRMWLVLIGYLVVVGLLAVAGEVLGGALPGYATLAVHLLLALEANQLRRAGLIRRGYRLVSVTGGRSLEEAEIRYFAGQATVAAPPASAPLPAPPAGGAAPPPADTAVIGLFPAPEGTQR